MKYIAHISYKGKNYRGWQKQINAISIQEILEENLSKLLKTKITCIGCGRTDAGVNASQYFFHFFVKEAWDFDLLYKLNLILPSDIALYDIMEVDSNFHAQYDAVERTYDYYIHTSKDSFLADISSYYNFDFSYIEEINKAVGILSKYTNYRAYCKTPDRHDSTICYVKSAKLYVNTDKTHFRFQIVADRFLKGMIRIIVAQLIEIAKGKLTAKEFEDNLRNKTQPKFFKLAYPQGLYLSEIKYKQNFKFDKHEELVKRMF